MSDSKWVCYFKPNHIRHLNSLGQPSWGALHWTGWFPSFAPPNSSPKIPAKKLHPWFRNTRQMCNPTRASGPPKPRGFCRHVNVCVCWNLGRTFSAGGQERVIGTRTQQNFLQNEATRLLMQHFENVLVFFKGQIRSSGALRTSKHRKSIKLTCEA